MKDGFLVLHDKCWTLGHVDLLAWYNYDRHMHGVQSNVTQNNSYFELQKVYN
ncbi:hypothetical protein Hanom_Chr08g00751251 [Helianthus anomalus]